MQKIQTDITIIGAGLTGLYLAYLLKDSGMSVCVLEARERLGGRIHSIYHKKDASIEMGATWLGRKHTALRALLGELELDTFEQQLGERAIYEPISTSPPQLVTLPPNTDPSFRIVGGSSQLIQRLANSLSHKQIHLGQAVDSIRLENDQVISSTDELQVSSSFLISTLPPNLLINSIKIHPVLPESFTHIAQQTHTWMGESIKVALSFRHAFWRSEQSSGTIMSNVGPIPEMYDHANAADDFFALKGFLNGSYYSLSREERQALVLNQLRKYYGNRVDDFEKYEEAVWANEGFTYAPYVEHVLPHQNNGHPSYREAYWAGKLFVAGSETADQFPGYMDGAVRSAQWVHQQLISK